MSQEPALLTLCCYCGDPFGDDTPIGAVLAQGVRAHPECAAAHRADPHAEQPTHPHVCLGIFDPDGVDHPFVYTVGLHVRGWPELLLIGAHPDTAAFVMNALADRRDPPTGRVQLEGAEVAFEVRPVDPAEARRDYARHAPDGAAISQIVIPDPEGHFPWEVGCAEPFRSLPVLPPPNTTTEEVTNGKR